MRRARALAAAAGLARGRRGALVAAAFRVQAEAWDAWWRAFGRPSTEEDEAALRLARRLAPWARGRALVEAGCGDGALLAALAPAASSVTGLDPSPEALRRARRRLGAEAALVRLRGWDLPLPGGSAGLVVMRRTLHHLDHEAAFLLLREARRVLASGGRLWLDVPNFHDAGHLRALSSGGTAWPSATRPRFWTAGMVRAALRAAGFGSVRLRVGRWIEAAAQQSATTGRRPRSAKKRAAVPAVR